MQSKKLKLALFLVLSSLILVSLAACRGQASNQIQTVTVKRGDIVLKISADGSLSLVQDRKLAFGTSGTIAEVNVKEGDRVNKGQVLANLDTADMERNITAAQLAVKSAQMDIQQAQSGITSAQTDAQQALDGVKNAEIDLETAINTYNRLLVPNPYVTYQFTVPESVDAIRVANARIDSAQAELQKILNGEQYSVTDIQNLLTEAQNLLTDSATKLGWWFETKNLASGVDYWTLRNLQLQIDKANLAVDNAKNLAAKAGVAVDNARNMVSKAQLAEDIANNNLAAAQDTLSKVTIISPFDGVVAQVNIKEGDSWTSVGLSTTAIEIIDPAQLELTVKVDEIDIPEVTSGQKAVISVDALPDETFNGTVSSIGSLPDIQTGVVSYEVKIALSVPPGTPLKSGMSATAELMQEQRNNVLLVPNPTIREDSQGSPYVEVLVNGQVQNRPIVLGISDGFQTEIISGLSEGETIVEPTSGSNSSGSIFGG